MCRDDDDMMVHVHNYMIFEYIYTLQISFEIGSVMKEGIFDIALHRV